MLYLVPTSEILVDYEMPLHWGLLAKKENVLELVVKPVWQNVSEGARLAILQRIASSATRKVRVTCLAHSESAAQTE